MLYTPNNVKLKPEIRQKRILESDEFRRNSPSLVLAARLGGAELPLHLAARRRGLHPHAVGGVRELGHARPRLLLTPWAP